MPVAAKRVPDWSGIRTVFLDMDGTLLDLHFDNYFWREHLPLRYGESHGLSLEDAKAELIPRFRAKEGTLQWYCLDHWTEELKLDVAALKRELKDMIRVHDGVEDFLYRLRKYEQRLVLVTNAHTDALALKLECTRIDRHFDRVVSSHEFGYPKETIAFWQKLQEVESFDSQTSLLVDDSLPVLRAAREFGIREVFAICRPDSQQPSREISEFPSVEMLAELIPAESAAY